MDIDIMEVRAGTLKDINEIKINMENPINQKIEEFMKDMEDPYLHRQEDYVVLVRFSEGSYTATDAMKHYLSKIAELNY